MDGRTIQMLKKAQTLESDIRDIKGDIKDVKGDITDIRGDIKEIKLRLTAIEKNAAEFKLEVGTNFFHVDKKLNAIMKALGIDPDKDLLTED